MPVALGADDPLLFGPRLAAQYEIARHSHGFTDPELAELARTSVLASAAPSGTKTRLLAGIDTWLSEENPLRGRTAAKDQQRVITSCASRVEGS